jgi:hypothetical protein
MSNLNNMKSASFYLQKIVDFMRAKTIEHRSINTYLELVKNNDIEVFGFLESVIMNRHRYQIAKQAFVDRAKEQEKFNGNLKIALIVLNAVVGVGVIIAVLIKSKLFSSAEGAPSASNKIKIVILTITGLFVYTIASYVSIVYCEQLKGDYGRAQTYNYMGERFFDKFENIKAVAMYQAHRFAFVEPAGPNRKVIKSFYDEFVTNNKKRVAAKMSLPEIRAHPEWIQIVDNCRPEYATVGNQPPLANMDITTQRELDSLANEENVLRMWDNYTLMQEIRSKSKSMMALVTKLKEGDIDDKLNDAAIAEVVKTDVVPLFLQRDIIHLQDIAIKDPSKFDITPTEQFTVESDQEGIIYMQRNLTCHLIVYDSAKKVCAAFDEMALPKNTILVFSKGSSIFFVKDEKETNRFVFLEGGELIELPKEPISDMAPKTSHCVNECMDDPTCVAFKYTDDKCRKLISMVRPSYDIVQRECSGPSCITYKFDINEIGRPIDRLGFFDIASSSLQTKVFQLSQKYNFEFKWLSYIDLIRTELEVAYQNNEIDLVMVKIVEVLEAADVMAKNSTKSVATKFISLDRFISKLDDMTLGDIMFYRKNVIQKLYDVIYVLHGKVEEGIANPTAVELNMFVEKERALQRQKILVYSLASCLVLAFAYYVAESHEKQGKDLSYVSLLMPLIFVGIVASIMISYHIKQESMYNYNRTVLESNNTKLLDSIFILTVAVDKLQKQAPNKSVKAKVGELYIREETKRGIYDNIVEVINMLERCNLTTDASNIVLPFPYVDISINVTMILVSISMIFYMVQTMSPVENIFQIRLANKIVRLVQDHPGKYLMKDFPELTCLSPDTSSLKVIGIIVFVIISVMFSTKVLRSSSEYGQGLYNSRYFAEARCVK